MSELRLIMVVRLYRDDWQVAPYNQSKGHKSELNVEIWGEVLWDCRSHGPMVGCWWNLSLTQNTCWAWALACPAVPVLPLCQTHPVNFKRRKFDIYLFLYYQKRLNRFVVSVPPRNLHKWTILATSRAGLHNEKEP